MTARPPYPNPLRSARPPGTGRGPARGAFTLLEVMLAMVVAAIVLAAIGGVFFGALRLRNRTTQAIETALPLERTLARIRRDLSGLVPPGGTLSGALTTSALTTSTSASTNTGSGTGTGASDSTAAASSTPQFGQVGPEFRSASAGIGEDLPWAEVQRIAYLLLESTNAAGGADLYRSVNRNLLGTGYDEPELEWLMGNVESLTFYYYDGTQWLEYWDSTSTTNTLPRGIKVELQRASAEPRGELPPLVELIVPILADGNTNQISDTMAASAATAATGGGGGGSGGAP